MRIRHRVPTIFSLSMLDVLCCGLGAVILLMILNFWDARRQATALAAARERVGETSQMLAAARAARDRLNTERDQLKTEIADMAEQRRAAAAEKENLDRDLARRQQDLRAAEKRFQEIDAKLTLAQRDKLDALAKLNLKEQERDTARKDADTLLAELTRQKQLFTALTDKLKTEEKHRKDAERIAGQLPNLRLELQDANRRARLMDDEVAAMKKRAEDAGLKVTDAEKQSQTVQVELAALRKLLDEEKNSAGKLKLRLGQAENRFAGVSLGGKRVVLIVDISGSMGYVDAQSADPNKWPEVCRAVGHVLASLSEVEKFQVVIFSDEVQFLLGKPGQWLEYRRDTSPHEVQKALLQITTKGNTNMHAAFDEAFRFKAQGLDTIFVFSDGLPNVGPGLPAQPPQDENARSALLGKYLLDTIRARWNAGPNRVAIHAVGFFYESPNLGAFLWALTRENGGSFVGMSKP